MNAQYKAETEIFLYATREDMQTYLIGECNFDVSVSTVKSICREVGLRGRVLWSEFLSSVDNGDFRLVLHRKQKLTPEQWRVMDDLLDAGEVRAEIARQCGVSPSLVTLRANGERGP